MQRHRRIAVMDAIDLFIGLNAAQTDGHHSFKRGLSNPAHLAGRYGATATGADGIHDTVHLVPFLSVSAIQSRCVPSAACPG